MTQVATNTNKQQEDKGRFVQFPIHLIYGCPELTRDDRFVLLAIMGEYWTKGPHKLSYRDIASLSRVPVSLLSSSKGKDGKPDKEGIVDRLVRLGLIKVTLGKELKSGRVTGNAQTFVEIEYKKIWQENVAYCEDRRLPENKEVEYQPVSYTNRLKTPKPVRIENEPVSYTNESVSYTNRPVPNTNNPVRDASSKVTPNITDIKTIKDKEDNVSSDTSHTQNPPTFSSQLGENDETPKGNPDTSMASVHDIVPAHSDNPVSDNTDIDTDVQKEVKETAFPIDGVTTRKDAFNELGDLFQKSPNEEKPAPKKRGSRKPKPPKNEKKITEEERLRIKAVFECLDELARETTGAVDFEYVRTKVATNDIHELISNKTVTPKNLRLVYMEMWNSPKGKDGFLWKENMSIAAICRWYDSKLLAAMGKQRAAKQNGPIAATPGSQYIVDALDEAAHAFLNKEQEDVYAAFL